MKFLNKKLITILLTTVVGSVVFTGCEKSSDVHTDLNAYIGFDGAENFAAIIGEGEVTPYRAFIADGKPYADIEMVQAYIDDRFYWDRVDGYVMYTDAKNIYSSFVGESSCYLDGAAEQLEYVISYVEDDVCYVSMEFIDKFSDIDYKYYEAEDNKPATLMVTYNSGEYYKAEAKKDNKLRINQDLMSDIVVEISKNDVVTVLDQTEEWYNVQTEDGFMGYVQKKYYNDTATETVERQNDYDTYTHTTMEDKVKLVWHQVTNEAANDTFYSLSGDIKGANVVSPTWFTMSNKKGAIKDISSPEYVDAAHIKGLKVWPLVDDFSADADGEKFVNTVLASTAKREKFEDNLLHALIRCRADGVNIDFEYISLENEDNYHQFLREMSIKCKKNGLVMTVDNYVPSDWSGYYDLNQQGRLADYVIVMSYDEYTAASEMAGPVASLPYVQKAVEDTVALVGDASRVIMGVPFYTRVWDEIPEELAEEGAKIIEDSVNGNYALNSRAVSMDTAREIYEAAGVEPVWNEETGTNYVYIENEAGNTQIWLEDATSIQKKLDVAVANNIGGCACWKLGLESSDIWDVIDAY